jgi:hypothetical protein
MSTPVLGRNARLLKSGAPIGHGKNINVKAPFNPIFDHLNFFVTANLKNKFRLLLIEEF